MICPKRMLFGNFQMRVQNYCFFTLPQRIYIENAHMIAHFDLFCASFSRRCHLIFGRFQEVCRFGGFLSNTLFLEGIHQSGRYRTDSRREGCAAGRGKAARTVAGTVGATLAVARTTARHTQGGGDISPGRATAMVAPTRDVEDGRGGVIFLTTTHIRPSSYRSEHKV